MMIGNLRAKPVLLGMVADFLAGLLFGVLASIVFSSEIKQFSSEGAALHASFGFLFSALVCALASSFVGGSVAARYAPGAELANATAVGVLSLMLTAALFYPLGMNDYPLAYNVPVVLLTVPACFLGGFLRQRSTGVRRGA